MEGSSQDRGWLPWLIGVAAVGLLLKAWLLLMGAFPFHADEAIVGLMARHILQGHWPVFFYGQAYMGSLDATLVALAFRLSGSEAVLAIRAVQSALYAATIATGMLLAHAITRRRRTAILCGLLLAVPTVNVTLYTTVSLGGYGEALLIGNLLMLSSLAYSRAPDRGWLAVVWGGLAGFGLWVFGLTLVFSVPTAILVIRTALRSRNTAGAIGLGSLVLAAAALGAGPWLWSVVGQGAGAFVSELLGSAIAGASPGGPFEAVGNHLAGLLLFGPTVAAGLRPPWGTGLLALPLAPVAAAFWLLAAYSALRSLRKADGASAGRWVLLGVTTATLGGLLVTPFGADPSGRYFLPLLLPLTIAAGAFLNRLSSGAARWLLLSAVLAFNLWGTLQSAADNPPGITTQFNPETRVDADAIPGLAERLLQLGELRGYTTYWVAYPLAFQSQERLIFVPDLPYHLDFRFTKRDNRYAPYNGMVESSTRVAYITFRHADLDRQIRDGLERSGIAWQETAYGDFHIYYGLSQPISPEQLNLPLSQ